MTTTQKHGLAELTLSNRFFSFLKMLVVLGLPQGPSLPVSDQSSPRIPWSLTQGVTLPTEGWKLTSPLAMSSADGVSEILATTSFFRMVIPRPISGSSSADTLAPSSMPSLIVKLAYSFPSACCGGLTRSPSEKSIGGALRRVFMVKVLQYKASFGEQIFNLMVT